MDKPSYERQNDWLEKYVEPIAISLDFGTVFSNIFRHLFGYRTLRARKDLRADMEKAGVFDSLATMEKEGTLWDREIVSEIEMGIILNKLTDRLHGSNEINPVSCRETKILENLDNFNLYKSLLTEIEPIKSKPEKKIGLSTYEKPRLINPSNLKN